MGPLGFVSGLFARLFARLRELLCRFFGLGCRCEAIAVPETCPIGWQPSVLTPVFYGVRELGEPPVVGLASAAGLARGPVPFGAPGRARVFFPSLDGSVFSAPILEGCARYPLVIFCHGSCPTDAAPYHQWFELPATLARSGYVVLVPHLPAVQDGSNPSGDNNDLALLAAYEEWMRTSWEHRDLLMPAPNTAVVGHSFGALLAGRYAADSAARAYASLSGVWSDWSDGPTPISTLGVPKFFTWGKQDSEFDAFTEIRDADWAAMPRDKHRAVFPGAGHWDYLRPGISGCEESRGDCPLVGMVTRDLVATFLGKYLPPENWPDLFRCLPDSLIAPRHPLTFEQEFYAGSHLMGLRLLADAKDCEVRLAWTTTRSSGALTRP